jgi:hypothetical protein
MPPTIFAELDNDWATLVESATATTALRRWQRDEPALAPFSTMTELVAAAHRRGAPAECDRILVALARRAGSDGLAARALLQLLLPGAKALARRLWWLGGPDERAAAVVGALYERVRTYPFDRRPAKVAANALADAKQRLLRDAPHYLPAEVPSAELVQDGLARADAAGQPSAAEELLELLGWAVADGHVSRRDACLIAQTRIADVPIGELGRREGLEAHSMRRRRQRAERRLAMAVAGQAAFEHERPGRVAAAACA